MVAATRGTRSTRRWLAGGAGLAAGSYAAYVGFTWLRYGRTVRPVGEDANTLLDRFMPEYEVTERHHARVAAPAETTFSAACEMDLLQSAVVRGIFEGRELIMGSESDTSVRPRAWLARAKSLGWGVLVEVPGHEVVLGAITKPWAANVVFRALPPHEFAAFREPGWVKIVWTLSADPIDASRSVFRTETRVATTDPVSRAKFRRYWSFLSPGIRLIRRASLGLVKREAERRTRAARSAELPTDVRAADRAAARLGWLPAGS